MMKLSSSLSQYLKVMSHPVLVAIIQDEIKKSGPIPFVRFMELALYHPEHGYYFSPRQKIGYQGGDFYTSPFVHPVFAKLLAKQLIQMAEGISAPLDTITFIEFGAGDGLLCLGILQGIEQQNPTLFQRLRYVIIEASPSFKLCQKERLQQYARWVRWEDKMPSASIGVVFSNELLDAFPVHRLQVKNGVVHEIYVDWKEDHFVEILVPSEGTLTAGAPHPTGQFEINRLALDWMHQVGQSLTKGFVLTLDYGYPAQQIYERKQGTFLCYRQHTVNENPYDFIGEQDMTSHVDFTALAAVGEAAGLSLLGFTDQTHFLMGLGIAEEMQSEAEKMHQSEEAQKNFLAMKQLMDPHGMGKTFKGLIQGKGIPLPIKLDGLTYPAYPKEILSKG